MKNLENFGVQELDAREIRSVEGGWWKEALGVAVFLLTTDWDQVADDMSRGFADAHK